MRAAYRKDPADAESILSAARERIRIFKSGFLDEEDAEDAERDEDSESDVAEDPEVDELGNEINPKKKEAEDFQGANKFNAKTLMGNGKESDNVIETPERDLRKVGEDLIAMDSKVHIKIDTGSSSGQSVDVAGICMDASNIGQEDTDIDESNLGEPWVQGLMEGEYSDLSVEERLNAVVALIGVAIEGNSIRLVLEVLFLFPLFFFYFLFFS